MAADALCGMALVLSGSLMFCVGGAFMTPSQGFTRPFPSAIVALCFMVGAVFLTRAVSRHGLSTTFIIGLGIEAVGAVFLGIVVLGEKVSPAQMGGIAMVVSGVAVLRL